MSPSTILPKAIWDENGPVLSFIRRFVTAGVFLYFWYLFLLTGKQNSNVLIQIRYTFFAHHVTAAIISLAFNYSFDSLILKGDIKFLDVISGKGKRGHFESAVKIIVQPFNPKVWKLIIKILYNDCKAFVTCKSRRFRNRTLKTLALCFYSVLALLICFVWVPILFCLVTSVSIFLPFMQLFF